MEDSPLYKKAYFQCARRAMLENEIVMCRFAKDVVKTTYNEEKLVRFNRLLTEMADNDMFDIIMGQKSPDFFKNKYDEEICRDIATYAEKIRVEERV